MSTMELYWLLKMDGVINLVDVAMLPFGILMVLSVMAFVGSWIAQAAVRGTDDFCIEPDEEDIKKTDTFARKFRGIVIPWLVLSCSVMLVLGVVKNLLPSTREMAVLYVVPRIMANEEARQIPGKLIELSGEWIDQMRPANLKQDVKSIVKEVAK